MNHPIDYISEYIEQQQLPASYGALAYQWFDSLAADIDLHQRSANKCFVVGINGAQGSGKSTLAALLVHLAEMQYGLNAISISLDDFYLTLEERHQLSETIHSMLATRGVPGTHDIPLAISTIKSIMDNRLPVCIPRFNKATDDRFAEEQLQWIDQKVDLIILEGWCLGSPAQPAELLSHAVNDLEQHEDNDGVWRSYVNEQLINVYPSLFKLVDCWIMLKAPSFNCVYEWRLQQEQALAKRLEKDEKQQYVMDDKAVAKFIKYYQRLTEYTLTHLPPLVNYLFEMDEHRKISSVVFNPSAKMGVQLNPNWLVFSDLDGSLLDHETYRYDEAIEVMTMMANNHIPLIAVSSKTSAEIEYFRKTTGNNHPYIIENGAAVYIPVSYFDKQPEDTRRQGNYWLKEFAKPRKYWQAMIDKLRPKYGKMFTTFEDAGVSGIMEMTGLVIEDATLAADRHYGEPISWQGSDELQQAFIQEIQSMGAQVLKGGRFMHISDDCDKGKALLWLKSLYQTQKPQSLKRALAIGDSHNDIAMLEQADYALLIRSPVHDLPDLERLDNTLVSSFNGPKGWAEGVSTIIAETGHLNSLYKGRNNHG
jgi:D-glycerate 3-kinase